MIYVFVMGSFVQPNEDDLVEWIRGAATSLCMRFMVPIERLSASLGHLGSRGVMWVVAMYGSAAAPWGLASLAIFALIDGVAVYGRRRKWRWRDPATCQRAHSSFMLLAVVEVGLFITAARHFP